MLWYDYAIWMIMLIIYSKKEYTMGKKIEGEFDHGLFDITMLFGWMNSIEKLSEYNSLIIHWKEHTSGQRIKILSQNHLNDILRG